MPEEAPVVSEYEFNPQFRHTLTEEALVVVEYLPAMHSTQKLASIAPVVVRYLPASQSVHAILPATILYFPVAHATQGPPFGPVNPMLQMQATKALLPLPETEPEGQFRHVDEFTAPTVVEYVFWSHSSQSDSSKAPTASEYLPATQLLHCIKPNSTLNFPSTQVVHCSATSCVNPSWHVQFSMSVAPRTDCVPSGHVRHSGTSVAPTVEENVLGSHFTHEFSDEAPMVFRYLPAPHSVHSTPPLTVLYFPAVQAIHVPPSGPV